ILPAQSSQQIVLGIDVPINAETRDWYAVLLAETRPLTQWPTEGNRVGTVGNLAANILIRISETNQEPLSWRVDVHGIPQLVDSLQSLTFTPLVTNSGYTHASPDLTMLVLDW